MEISQIIDHIFKNQTNINALVVITALTVLALFGTFKSKNSKIRHFAKQSPAILATVGIFFSFWGISIGLIGLDLNDIQNSIPKLLDGLKAKFLASLMGIFASILVRIAQSFTIEQEVEEINLDEKMVNLLTDIHKVLANNASNSPEALLQELKQAIGELPIEFRKQNVLLDSIKSSLAGEGDASVTTQLAKLRMDMRDALTVMDKRNTQRGDLLNKTLTSNFGDLTKKFDEFARVVAENNSKAFIEALEKAMRDFNNNITEQFGENFKQLNHAVGELLKWQENYKSHVETLTGNFEVALNSLSSIQTAFSDIQTRSQSFIEVSSELGIILQKLDVQLQDLNNYLKSMDQVADSAKQAFPIIEDNLTKLTMGFKKSTEQSLASINSTVESVSEDLVETTNRFKETSVKLRDSMENQRETLEKTSDEFKDVVSVTLKNLAKETKNSIENYQESLQETVTKQLDSIDSNIKQSNVIVNTTIKNASAEFEKSITETGAVLKTSTDTVANHLTSATTSMKNMIEDQQSTLSSTSNEFKTVVNQTLRDLSQETQSSIKTYQESLQETVTKQLDSIDSNIKQSNVIVNTTIKNASAEFEKAIKTQAESMNKTIAIAGDSFKTVIQNTAKEFEVMAETIAESVELQSKTLTSVSQDVKLAVDKTLRDLNEQSQRSIKEYENSLHNIIMSQFNTVKDSVNAASKDFNRLLAENTEKSTSVLVQQTQLLDTALQEELKKAIETMGKHLAALSNQFVQDYRPLTDKLREVVKLAEDLKMRGH
jgi:hypothetical protein